MSIAAPLKVVIIVVVRHATVCGALRVRAEGGLGPLCRCASMPACIRAVLHPLVCIISTHICMLPTKQLYGALPFMRQETN